MAPARLSNTHATCMAEAAVCLKLVWCMHAHFWVLCNPSTLKVKKKKKKQKTTLLIVVGSQQTCPLSAHLSPVAALNPLVPSPLTTYCHLFGGDVTPRTGSHQWRTVQSWLGRRSLIKVEAAVGTRRSQRRSGANINGSDAFLNIGGKISGCVGK